MCLMLRLQGNSFMLPIKQMSTHITLYTFNKVRQLALDKVYTHAHTLAHKAKRVKQVLLIKLVRCAASQAFVPFPFKGKKKLGVQAIILSRAGKTRAITQTDFRTPLLFSNKATLRLRPHPRQPEMAKASNTHHSIRITTCCNRWITFKFWCSACLLRVCAYRKA